MGRRPITITEEKVQRIKIILKNNGIRETARKSGVSYYTAWCISQGKYDSSQPLQQPKELFNKCPITGYKLSTLI